MSVTYIELLGACGELDRIKAPLEFLYVLYLALDVVFLFIHSHRTVLLGCFHLFFGG